MLSRIASRLQELFAFGSDNKKLKRQRPSDAPCFGQSPFKRPRLTDIDYSDKESTVVSENSITRPSLTRDCHRSSDFKISSDTTSTTSTTSNTKSQQADCQKKQSFSDLKSNGFDYSEIGRTVGERKSFEKEDSDKKTKSLLRPSLGSQKFDCFSTNENNSVVRVPPSSSSKYQSIFEKWFGGPTEHDNTVLNNYSSSATTTNNNNLSSGESHSNRRVEPKELTVRQCFRMEEKKKYKALLARYVSPILLDTIDLTSAEVPQAVAEVITISDSDSEGIHSAQAGTKSSLGESSPLVFNSSESSSPCSSSVLHPRIFKSTNVANTRNTIKATSISIPKWSDLDPTSWRSVERRAERAAVLLDEFARPVVGSKPNTSGLKSNYVENSTNHVDLIQNFHPREVVIVDGDGESSLTSCRSPANQSKFTSPFSQSQSKKTSAYDTINIDDTSDEGDEPDAKNRKEVARSESSNYSEDYVRPSLRSGSLMNFEMSLKTSPFVKKNFLQNLLDKAEGQARSLRVRETEAELMEMRKMRKERDAQCNKKISHLIRLTRRLPIPLEETFIESEEEVDVAVLIEEVERIQKDEYPELNNNQEAMVGRALRCNNPSQILVNGFKLQITSRDISTLAGLNWLNDEVINFYLNLVVDRSLTDKNLPPTYTFNTFFYPKVMSDGQRSVRRWTKNVDIFANVYILVPVHLGVHWCLAVIDFRMKEIRYYDSMGGYNNKCLDVLLDYLVDEMKDKKQEIFDTSGWKKINVKDIPQQMNGSDCGMFACKFAEYITRNTKITFNQSHMPYFRRRMVFEILSKQLM